MAKTISFSAALFFLAALTVLPAMSKSDKTGQGAGQADKMEQMKGSHGKPASSGENGGTALGGVFDEVERQLIRDYFHDQPVPAEALPPGIAKNLARGKPLPPGIAKRFLPDGLVSQLPDRPGYERILVGDDVVLVDAATQIIVDILNDVMTP